MSVINQMLQDLENRRSHLATADNYQYQHLNFSSRLPGSEKLITILYAVLFGIILASVILVFVKFNSEQHSKVTSAVLNDQTDLTQTITDRSKAAGTMLQLSTQSRVSTLASSRLAPATTNETHTNSDSNQTKSSKQNSKISSSVEIKKVTNTISIPSIDNTTTQNRQTSSELTTVIVLDKSDKDGIGHKRKRELSSQSKAEKLYQSAYQFLLAKNQLNAQDELRNALMIKPGHNKSRELLAGIYIKNARIVEARTLLQYGMRISPTHHIFAKLYARILMDEQDIVTAISVLLRNPPTHRSDPDYFALLAALYQKNKQHHEAASLYSDLLTIRNNYGVWWLGMAISLEALGNKKQAMSAYEKAKNSGSLSEGLAKYSNQRVVALEEIAYP